MVEKAFQILVAAILFVSLAGLIIVIFSSAQQSLDSGILQNLRSRVITNVTSAENFDGQAAATGRILNATPTMIRNTPQFSCDGFFLYDNATGTGASINPIPLVTGSSVVAGTTEVWCVQSDGTSFNTTHGPYSAGTVMLLLAGNSSNATATLGRGSPFNISYTAKVFDASWNTTRDLQDEYVTGGNLQSQYYMLIILAIILSVGLFLLGIRFFSYGGEVSGGGFSLGGGDLTSGFDR